MPISEELKQKALEIAREQETTHLANQVDFVLMGSEDERFIENLGKYLEAKSDDIDERRYKADIIRKGSFNVGNDKIEIAGKGEILQLGLDVYENTEILLDDPNNPILICNGQAYVYEVKALGQGENGSVHKAKNLATGEEIVIKMQFGREENGEFVAAEKSIIENEHKISTEYGIGLGAAALNSPSTQILEHVFAGKKVVTAEYVNPPVYIQIQKLVPGRPLDKIKIDSPAEAIKLAKNIVAAIKEIHEKIGVYHRDIRPENILVDENLNVRIIDFGAALKFDQQSKIAKGLMGYTEGFTHPDIIKAIGDSGEAVQFAYAEKHEAYSVSQVLKPLLELAKMALDTKDTIAGIDAQLAKWKPAVPSRPSMNTSKSAKDVRATAPSVPIRSTKSTSALSPKHPFLAREFWEKQERDAAAKRKQRETLAKGEPKPQIIIPGYNDGKKRPSDKL